MDMNLDLDANMEFKFREIRDELELKQINIATKINISRGAYANIEAETANIKLKDFLIYCNVFNFTMDFVANLDSQNRISDIQNIDNIDKIILSEHLNILEKENHKQAQDIAKELGIQKSTYSEYKNPKSNNMIQTLMLKQLAKTYDYSMDWLVGRSNQKYIKK